MKILVLNGSPKGDYSVTLQTIRYLELVRPQHSFEVLNIGAKIKYFERNLADFERAVAEAELIMFAFPVYTFIAPYQVHRFIELIKERGIDLSGKYATTLTTSKHFYDMTAHGYIRDNCHDLGMKYIKGLSADMDDLTTEKGRQEAEAFLDYVAWQMAEGLCERAPEERAGLPLTEASPVMCERDEGEKTGDVVIITNREEDDEALLRMIQRFVAVSKRKCRVVNIREFPFIGGCLGCFRCAVSGKCVYKDGFDSFLRDELQTAEAMVYAFSIKDHSMGASFKLFDDRQFCNGHRTVTMGMPVGYIISGRLSEEENLRTIIEARADVGGNHLAGIAGNEGDANQEIDELAKRLEYALEKGYKQPQTFYGVGGMKIFRDLIWLMQGIMRADHKFYKAHGQYDFPQKKRGTMLLMKLLGGLLALPGAREKMGGKMREGMLMPYKKVLDKTRRELEKRAKRSE